VRPGDGVGRHASDPRCGDRDPQPAAGSRPLGRARPHPAHAPPPGPHPGPAVLRAAVPTGCRGDPLGAGGAGRPARAPHRALPLGAADAGGDPRAAVPARLPRLPDHALADRLGRDRRGGRHAPRADARVPGRGRRQLALLPARPRARDRRRPRRARGRVAVGVLARPRRRPADPRLPVHRRRVPRPRRLGPLLAHAGAAVRPQGRRPQHAAVPPRSGAHRRRARRHARGGPRAVDGGRRPGGRDLDGRGGRPLDGRDEHRGDRLQIPRRGPAATRLLSGASLRLRQRPIEEGHGLGWRASTQVGAGFGSRDRR
jgi:hypothetical protein